MLATPFAASAQPVTGLYVGLGAGVNITQKTDVNNIAVSRVGPGIGFANTGLVGGSYNGSTGFAGVLSLGWGFGNGLRAEIEGNYRSNQNNGFSGNTIFSGLGVSGGGTQEQKYGGMVNVLYDFNGVSSWVVPYIGAGVGYVGVNERWKAYNGVSTPGFPAGAVNVGGQSTQGAFAYQAILGAAVPCGRSLRAWRSPLSTASSARRVIGLTAAHG